MTSILTNVSAQVALQTLRQINDDLATTNNRVSTGLRIATAADSSAYWAISAVTRSDNSSLGATVDALGVGRNVVDVAYQGLEAAREGLEEIRDLLVTARSPGINRNNIQEQITGILTDLRSTAEAATINEQNILVGDSTADNATLEVVSTFQRTANGSSISTIDVAVSGANAGDGTLLFDTGGTVGVLSFTRSATAVDSDGNTQTATISFDVTDTTNALDISALTDSVTDLGVLEATINAVDAALQEVITNQNRVGVALNRIDAQIEFNKTLMDANDRAIGILVDADLEAESTRLRALQTQQQLGIQSLAIANQSSQNVLQLFG